MDSVSSLWHRAFDSPAAWQTVALALLPALLIAWLAARMVRRVATRLLHGIVRDTVATSSPLVRGPLRLISAAAFVLVLGLIIAPVFELAGLQPRTGVGLRPLTTWIFGSGLRILLIGALGYALVRAVTLLVTRFEHEVNRGTTLDALERAKRGRTLGSLIRNVASALIGGIAALMILRELGVDIAPVLAGAGVAGLAIGFGAQTLVRDIISGFFLILEDQVRVGDVAAINGQGGLVEAINLRTIVLRDFEGIVHVFPNGAITTLANRSKDFSFYVIDLGISYREDPQRVIAVLKETGAALQADERFGPHILEPLDIVGVDAFADWSVQLKMRIKTVPLKQWEVGRELRRRILIAFAEHGIDIPFPERVVTMKLERPDEGPPNSRTGLPT
ncbi:MAG TPA: mechanosensitive ion channel family protein [Vicinamibacterales bacterium]|nr:mechanosensitive ion channel family protein [Vicinamibacterales bacterium]